MSRFGKLPTSRRAQGVLREAPISWLMRQALEVPGLLSLAAGFVDEESLPAADLRTLVDELLTDTARAQRALQYGTTQGLPRLRQQILDRLRLGSDAPIWSRVGAGDVLITNGSQQFLYLLSEVLLDPGDLVVVEDPSYFVYVDAVKSFGAELVGVPSGQGGMSPEALDDRLTALSQQGLLPRVKVLYLMSYFQNPTGSSLTARNREALWSVFVSWLDRGLDAVLVEDAAYRELRFDGVCSLPGGSDGVDDQSPLFERQSELGRVCYVGSFSKSLSPGLRLGFGIAPPELLQWMVQLKSHHDFGSSHFCQSLVSRALDDGLYDQHLARIRRRYREKSGRLVETLRSSLGDSVNIWPCDGGLYVWVETPGIDTGRSSALFQEALAAGVLYVPGELCAVPESAGAPVRPEVQEAMRLCFTYPRDEALVEAGRRLAGVLDRHRACRDGVKRVSAAT